MANTAPSVRSVQLFVLVLVISATACGSTGPFVWGWQYPSSAPVPTGYEAIRPGDEVSVRVFGQEPMSVKGRVRTNGTLTIPLIGEYPATGKQPALLAQELERRLAPFVTSPHVSVVIEASTVRVTVIGEVTRSGRATLENPARIVDALAEAGGLNEFADEDDIFVLRGRQRIRFTYDDITRGEEYAQRFLLQSGDVVVVE